MVDRKSTEQGFYQRMVDMIERRYLATANKSLRNVYDLDADFLNTDADADFAIRNQAKILSVLARPDLFEALVQVFVNLTIEFTYASNQFIQLNSREEAELRRIYAVYLRDFQRILSTSQTNTEIAERVKLLVAGHFGDLRANITRFFDPETGEKENANSIFNRVVCAEYSPELQLEIFGLRATDLIAPVLDLGCGKSGELVRYLNVMGVEAVGIDRMVDSSLGGSTSLIQADWLEFRLEPGVWGTILSHMAFSNHFVFQHWYTYGQVQPYARQYMAALGALKPGGSFYYTPGLPFIETYLPEDSYRVTRRIVTGELYASRVLRIK